MTSSPSLRPPCPSDATPRRPSAVLRLLAVLVAVLVVLGLPTPASAGGTTSEDPFPAPPPVDLSAVPEGAVATPESMGDDPHPVTARLLRRQSAAMAGSTVQLGIHLTQKETWHTYWKAPGDIGMPTEAEWTLPEGARISPFHQPIPLRYDQSGMISYGYDDQVLHIAELTLPDDLPPGEHPIEARVSWLVCQTSCIPGEVTLKTSLTVADAPQPTAFAPLFAHYETRWPTPPDDLQAVEVSIALKSTPVVPNMPFEYALHIRPTEGHTLGEVGDDLWPTFAPIYGLDWMVLESEVVRLDDGSVVAHVKAESFEPDPLPTDDRAGGLVQVPVDDGWVRTEVTLPLPWAAAGAEVTPTDAPVFQALAAADGGDGSAEADGATASEASDGDEAADHGDDGAAAFDEAAEASVGGDGTGVSAYNPAVLLGNLGMAFLGGLILNIMPCVLPVLMLKLYSLVEQGGISDGEKRQAGLAYTAGILVSFWALAGAVWGIRALLGEDVGWGFQMQYPGYVAGLATLVFLFSLSLFGVYEIPAPGAGGANELSSREGLGGYFFTGVFATLVATPCSAPLLGTAIAFAFQAPTPLLVAVFSFIGLGLAAPFLLVAFVPAAYRLLPRPGPWMETFKQLLGFTLVATTLWLVDVLVGLIGADRVVGFLAFLGFVSVGAWIFGRWGGVSAEARRQLGALAVGVAVSALGAWQFLDLAYAEDAVCDDGAVATASELSFDHEIPWQHFTDDRVDALQGELLFVDFTADWCVSCKVNEKTVLETATVREAMSRLGVVPLKADWTRRNPEISAWLERFGRAGVPMYLVIPASGSGDAVLLPEVITTGMVVDALEGAATEQLGVR